MDSGRLHGLTALSGNIACCCAHHGQFQLVTFPGLQKMSQSLILHSYVSTPSVRSKGRAIKAAMVNDMAAIAVAAAAVLPVCWIYFSRSQSSSNASSDSSAPPNSKVQVTVAGSSSVLNLSSSATVVPDTVTCTSPMYANGVVTGEVKRAISGSPTGMIINTKSGQLSLSRLTEFSAEEEWQGTSHETRLASAAEVTDGDDRSGNGRTPGSVESSSTISWLDQGGNDLPENSLNRRLAPDFLELSGLVANMVRKEWGATADDEIEEIENRSMSASTASPMERFAAESFPEKKDPRGQNVDPPLGTLDFRQLELSNPSSLFETNGSSIYHFEVEGVSRNLASEGPPLNGAYSSLCAAVPDFTAVDITTLDNTAENGSYGSPSHRNEVPSQLSAGEGRRDEFEAPLEAGEHNTSSALLDLVVGDQKKERAASGLRLGDGIRSPQVFEILEFKERAAGLADERDAKPTSVSQTESILESMPFKNILEKKMQQNGCAGKLPGSLADILPIDIRANPEVYLTIYDKMLRLGRIRESVALLEELNKVNLLDMNKACQKHRAVREAFRFTRLMRKPSLRSFNRLLLVCRAAKDVDGALRALSAVEKAGLKPDTILYTTLISTCAKAANFDVAFKVFHDMETAGVEPNVHTFGAMIDGCAKAGHLAKAFGVYGIMISKKLKPDRVIFNSLINACGRCGAIERAFDVLADMKAELTPVKPDHVTMGALVSACARAGQVDRAFEVYAMMQESGIKGTPQCYTAAVHACSQTGDLERALGVYEDIIREEVQPDEVFFSALIDVAGHANQIDAAFKLLQDMRTVGITPGSVIYSALMGVCSNTGNWERAMELYQEIKAAHFQPSTSTFNALITALCDSEQLGSSLKILQEMRQARVDPNQITYSILLESCEKAHEPGMALDLYTSARAEGVIPNQGMCDSIVGEGHLPTLLLVQTDLGKGYM